jgi:aryl-alcohol dehydrogenase-like predicted oxidoreductase
VRYVGISNFSAWATMKARGVARELGIDVTFLQPMYNLVKRQAVVEILPMAASEGFYVCPYSPLGGGLLTGKYVSGGGGRIRDDKMYATRYALDWMHEAAAGLKALADEVGVHPATLAVAWVARHAGVWGPIVSARSAEQLRPSLAAIGFEMDDAFYARVSALSPTPPPANDRLEEA